MESFFFFFVRSSQAATPTRKIAAMPSAVPPTVKRVDVSLVEEASELEELEQFAKAFKQRRIKLGFTQVCQVHNAVFGCDGLMML